MSGRLYDERPRFLSESECRDIGEQLTRAAIGGGYTVTAIKSSWAGNIRWARNQVISSGETLNHRVMVARSIKGAASRIIEVNDTDSATLLGALRRAERLVALVPERPQQEFRTRRPIEPTSAPQLFSMATYDLDAEQRSRQVRALARSAVEAGMHSAGYVEVSAHSQAIVDSLGRMRYFQYTSAQYSVTVRNPAATGSGWAGVDSHDWTKIDGAALSTIALQKCLSSRDPVSLEPGRYTTILEPQAVCDLVTPMLIWMGRQSNEGSPPGPFQDTGPAPIPRSLIGQKIFDDRITVTSDPMDPELGTPPFDTDLINGDTDAFEQSVFHKATWVDRGVLVNLGYGREYAISSLGKSTGLPMNGSLRMSGGASTVEEMIASTARGVLVTRFDRIRMLNMMSQLYAGYTRDGLWLIENGKISKPIKNFAFTESPMFILNKVQMLGKPQRVFHPAQYQTGIPTPVIVPPLKVGDFSFTSLSDAV